MPRAVLLGVQDQPLEELTRLDHRLAQFLGARVLTRLGGRVVHPAVTLHLVRVVHGEGVDVVGVLARVREAAVGRQPGDQLLRLDDGLSRRVDETLLETGPVGDVLVARLGGQGADAGRRGA